MIYKIKLICDEVEGFVREIEIDSDALFLDLNKAILDSCGYTDDQMTSFYICDDEWERGQQVTREDMGVGPKDEDIFVMDQIRLSELIEDEGQKMEFVFDPFNERVFSLDVKEFIPGKSLTEPVVTRTKGKAPKQLEDMDLEDGKPGKGQDDLGEDSEFYGTDEFNSEEFDPEGYEISEGEL